MLVYFQQEVLHISVTVSHSFEPFNFVIDTLRYGSDLPHLVVPMFVRERLLI
jgi:hypothetical protein